MRKKNRIIRKKNRIPRKLKKLLKNEIKKGFRVVRIPHFPTISEGASGTSVYSQMGFSYEGSPSRNFYNLRRYVMREQRRAFDNFVSQHLKDSEAMMQ